MNSKDIANFASKGKRTFWLHIWLYSQSS